MGWGVLHLFATVGPHTDAEAVTAAVKDARDGGDQVVAAAILGHKADVALMVISADLRSVAAPFRPRCDWRGSSWCRPMCR